MQRISITNPQNIIDGTAKKYYFKLRNTGGPKGDKGDKGDTGATGPQGPQGDPCTVVVNSTATLEPGSNAYVTNTGSLSNAVLNFGIPKGDRGPQGAKGDKGDTGAQGETGPRGPQGDRGTNATVSVGTTSTLNPGSQATVYNSGTDSNAVLNFEIPRGDVGPMPTIAQTTGQSTTEVMSQKATTDALSTKQNTLTAGANIQIQNGTISATDTTYTAGNGLNLNGTEFSADTDILATKEDLEGYYTKPETDNLLAPKLEAEVVAELPTTGEEGRLYLTPKAHTTQTATGNPITATVAEETGKIESFQLDGDTLQNGTPTPEEPVPIQTVTGTQTISINGTDYPLDLGSIELCKLGTYQDYIWKDGDSWKLHKETHSVTLTGAEEWQYPNVGSSAAFFQLRNSSWQSAFGDDTLAPTPGTNVSVDPSFFKSTKFVGISAMDDNMKTYQGIGKKGEWFRISLLNTWNVSTVEQLQTWLSDNNVPVTYVLATATDTAIIDTTLIAQLEAIRTASLENGTNIITNIATGTNLAGDMEIGYYGFAPRNRYDKWLWLDLNNNYEQIGGE